MKLMFLEETGKGGGSKGGGLFNNILNLNKPEKLLREFVEKLKSNNYAVSKNKFLYIPASKSKNLLHKKKK